MDRAILCLRPKEKKKQTKKAPCMANGALFYYFLIPSLAISSLYSSMFLFLMYLRSLLLWPTSFKRPRLDA